MFDTDGCIYNKYGNYLQIQYKFSNLELIEDIRKSLIKLRFNPSKIQKEINNKNKRLVHWKIYLCRQEEIDRFMNKIKPKNNKHLNRYNKIRGHSITR